MRLRHLLNGIMEHNYYLFIIIIINSIIIIAVVVVVVVVVIMIVIIKLLITLHLLFQHDIYSKLLEQADMHRCAFCTSAFKTSATQVLSLK